MNDHSQLFRLLALLLDYPRAELREESLGLHALIRTCELPEALRDGLAALLNELCQGDLLDVQARYDGLFERGSSVSLLLFEHVHGESRDRGQAMVDLLDRYTGAGLQIDVPELPDYLPLYLEYLSLLPFAAASEGLAEVAHILGLLALRLEERGSAYAAIFEALLELGGERPDLGALRRDQAQEQRDDSLEAIDRAWEETPVSFTDPAGGCPSSSVPPSNGVHRTTIAMGRPAGTADAVPRGPRRSLSMSTNLLFFGIYPYVALLICLVGSWARFDLSQYTWKAGSSQMLSKKGMRVYSNLFHVGVLFILAGHFVGLLTPASVYHHLISTENKQLLAMVSGGFFGVLCFIGLSGLILRRLTDARVRATGNASDLMILLVLYAQLILGLSTIVASTHHMDGSVMVMLAEWAQAIVTLRPLAAAEAIAPVGLVYKLHVGLGLTLFVLFPFTRLVHIVSAPVWYLGRRYQIVRQKRPA